MQAHRTSPPADRSLHAEPAPPAGSVQGLGLTDALRVELHRCQVEGLREELDELRGPLDETYEKAHSEWLALNRREVGAPPWQLARAQGELSDASQAVHVLAALRAQVPRTVSDQPLVIVGPTDMVSTIIEGAARNTVAKVAESLDEYAEIWRAEDRDELRRVVAVAHAWVDTYADCQAVEWFSFDRNTDHVRPG
jgi:hypothetical protein